MGRVHPSRSHCPAGLTGRGLQSRDWEGGGTSLSTHPCPALSRLGLQEEAWETRPVTLATAPRHSDTAVLVPLLPPQFSSQHQGPRGASCCTPRASLSPQAAAPHHPHFCKPLTGGTGSCRWGWGWAAGSPGPSTCSLHHPGLRSHPPFPWGRGRAWCSKCTPP